MKSLILPYAQRAQYCQNPTAKKLLLLMEEKQSNLCVSADITTSNALLDFIDAVGSQICVLKTHIDIVEDFSTSLITHLQQLSQKHHFLIFEDRKFADIGHTAKLQYSEGIYKIAEWAHITNAHSLPGPGIIHGLREVGLPRGNGLLLLAEMSSKGNLIDSDYTQTTVDLAAAHKDFVIGFISQHSLSSDPAFIHFTPGIHKNSVGDNLGQQYVTPEEAIVTRGADVVIAGRAIYEASDPTMVAKQYREESWAAYQKRQAMCM